MAFPWDVPGSYTPPGGGDWDDPGALRLALQDDSNRYEFRGSLYLKHGDGPFVQKKNVTLSSTWNAQATPPNGSPILFPALVKAAAEGWDTYRFAVACIMRGVPQQVAVTFQGYTPA